MKIIHLISISLILAGSIVSSLELAAQESLQSSKVVKPILLDKTALSGIGLDTIELKIEPNRAFFQKNLFRGNEISVYVVSSESWISTFNEFWFDEFICILNGRARVISGEEEAEYFHANEFFFAPKGFPGSWEVQAGGQIHYELSVITNNRADADLKSTYTSPFLLDKTKLSGFDFEFNSEGKYQETLADGIELDIFLHIEKPRLDKIESPRKEQLICLLSGQIEIKDLDGNQHIFSTGDYFVLPDGLIGTWQSRGHGQVKYLSIRKSE